MTSYSDNAYDVTNFLVVLKSSWPILYSYQVSLLSNTKWQSKPGGNPPIQYRGSLDPIQNRVNKVRSWGTRRRRLHSVSEASASVLGPILVQFFRWEGCWGNYTLHEDPTDHTENLITSEIWNSSIPISKMAIGWIMTIMYRTIMGVNPSFISDLFQLNLYWARNRWICSVLDERWESPKAGLNQTHISSM